MAQSRLTSLKISDIWLDEENPRIKQTLEIYKEVTAEVIANALSDDSDNDAHTSYRSLLDSIKASGGIIHPILVDHNYAGKYVVIEGNTRVQIYKDLLAHNVPGNWTEIPALVYEQLSDFEKHEIRLQSHLVGPRDWNPYSRAKYLYYLSHSGMPMQQIIAMCGGRASEIDKYIRAYEYMEDYYRPYINSIPNYDFDPQQFSKFLEYQNSRIQGSIKRNGYAENQFAKWVADGNVDKAMSVRRIPDILKNEDAHKVFINNNLTEAEKVLHAAELLTTDLSEYPYEKLAQELRIKLDNITLTEVKKLATSESHVDKRDVLELLQSKLNFILDEVKNQDE